MEKKIPINQISYDENRKPKIYVNKNELFPQISRSGTDINWNDSDCCFESISLQNSDVTDFFHRTINSVISELGIYLVLKSITKISNISTRELEQLINTFYYFELNNHANYPIVYVHENGSITEVQLSDRLYLQTKYHGADGDRPYIKEDYLSTTNDGRKSGYCFRNTVPNKIIIRIPENNNMFMNIKQMLERIKKMNYKIDYKEIEYVKLLEEYEEKNA